MTNWANKAQSFERRWQRFFGNRLVEMNELYLLLVLPTLSQWEGFLPSLILETPD
ncbi:MAG: hypothetical protein AAF289_04705 [Cyanobacteria bacterium P01_A01_bin.135]